MPMYRKKPVVIEAMQWDGSEGKMQAIQVRWPGLTTAGIGMKGNEVLHWSIATLEGSHIVSVGDYIIKGVKGEFYPCKPDIFELTYEAALGVSDFSN